MVVCKRWKGDYDDNFGNVLEIIFNRLDFLKTLLS